MHPAGRGLLEAFIRFPVLPHVPFSLAGFALFPFSVLNLNCKYDYMLNPVSFSSKSLNLGIVMGTSHITIINIHTQVFLWMWFSFCLSIYLGVRLLGLMVSICFSFIKNCQIVFIAFANADFTILHFHWQCMRVRVAPHPCQHLVLSGVFKILILIRCNGISLWFQFAFLCTSHICIIFSDMCVLIFCLLFIGLFFVVEF